MNYLKALSFSAIMALLTIPAGTKAAEEVMVTQTLDYSLNQDGEFATSTDKGSLFDLKFSLDLEKKVLVRTGIRRHDKDQWEKDFTVYTIVKIESLMSAPIGKMAKLMEKFTKKAPKSELVYMAVGAPGSGNIETVWLGRSFMLSTRNSGAFSYLIGGHYKRTM